MKFFLIFCVLIQANIQSMNIVQHKTKTIVQTLNETEGRTSYHKIEYDLNGTFASETVVSKIGDKYKGYWYDHHDIIYPITDQEAKSLYQSFQIAFAEKEKK